MTFDKCLRGFKQWIDRIGFAIYRDHSGCSCRKERGHIYGRRLMAMMAVLVRYAVSQDEGINSGNGEKWMDSGNT